MVSVLFVCLANICRSPAAEEVLRTLGSRDYADLSLHVESCGIGSWQVGQLPDERMRHAAKRRGLSLTSRAKQFEPEFFERFDYILAADDKVLKALYQLAQSPEHKAKVHLLTAFSPCFKDQSLPDPYYHGEAGFEQVLDMIEDACEGFLAQINKKRNGS